MTNITLKQVVNYGSTCLLLLIALTKISYAGHPGEEQTGMTHPSVALPKDASLPYINATLSPDMMDGFNLKLDLENFYVVMPLVGADEYKYVDGKKVMQGHVHLYINGEKKMRIYGDAVHISSSWVKPGINSLSVSINNHMHGTFTKDDREIQTTIIFNIENQNQASNEKKFIKSQYSWPNTDQRGNKK